MFRTIVFCISMLCTTCLWAGLSTSYISYYPRVMYGGELTTFVLSLATDTEVAVVHNGVVLQKRKTKAGVMEISLKIETPGMLEVTADAKVFTWRVVSPKEQVALVMRHNNLYADKVPVVLLVEHLFPPKDDRTWEVAKWMYAQFNDSRPVVAGGLHQVYARTEDKNKKVFELNTIIAHISSPLPEGVFIIKIGLHDIYYGMSFLEYRMRIEWLCQRLRQPQSLAPLFLVVPPPSKTTPLDMPSQLYRLATRANDGVVFYAKEDENTAESLHRAVREVRKMIHIP